MFDSIRKFWRIAYYYVYSRFLIKKYAYKRLQFEDRDTLERVIFPYLLAHQNPQTILDIGREDYQAFYNLFFKGRELWTIDKKRSSKEFGAKNHIIDDVVNLKEHFADNHFDLVIMNGVLGWGLNEPRKIEQTLSSIYDIMKTDGILVIGWNNLADLTPLPLANIKALQKFESYYFPALKSKSFQCPGEGNHTYNFYKKS